MTDYTDLQINIDKAIGKFGVRKTVMLLRSFLNDSTIGTSKKHKAQLLSTYVISQSITAFSCDEDKFYTSRVPEYKEARMACFYLLKKYTKLSYAMIGELFGQNKRHVLYYCLKCDEILSIPQYYNHFIAPFNALEENVLDFLGKLK